MTDRRNDATLERDIARLPRSSGIIFRHYYLSEQPRARRLRSVARVARRHGHTLFVADPPTLLHIDGIHLRGGEIRRHPRLPHSAAVHDLREWRAARAQRVAIILLSPILPTRSHPGGDVLKPALARRIIAASPCPVILLGGMTAQRFRRLASWGAHGWAAVDGLRS